MPDPKFTKPWHGIPREDIHWNPTILEDVCIGCGTCVTGCSRLVYRFDFDRKKPTVVDPLNCMVGCTTCANTCPAHAIVFPPMASVLALEGLAVVRHAVEDDLLARHDVLAAAVPVPHPDRIVTLKVVAKTQLTADVLDVVLAPVQAGACFCEFVPGQYIEVWQPGSDHLSRSYSIANAPTGDGRIELQLRRVSGGRLPASGRCWHRRRCRCRARRALANTCRSAPCACPRPILTRYLKMKQGPWCVCCGATGRTGR